MIILLLASAIAATTTTDWNNGHGAFGVYGGWSYQPEAPALDGVPTSGMMSCGGAGITVSPRRTTKRGRRGRHTVELPSHQRAYFGIFDMCWGVGQHRDAFFLSPVQVGYGGQWGGQTVYMVAMVVGGLGVTYEGQGPMTMNSTGLTARPRLALGFQPGLVQFEVGPTLRTTVPWVTRLHNTDVRPQWHHTGISVDLDIRFGNSSPRPNERFR